VIPYFLVFSIIDFIAILFYIIKQDPQGGAKVISYTALIIMSMALVYSLIAMVNIGIALFD
jgi:hypothetical protein